MKLKKLILSGFKSFADRTELEFDGGISCVVGPNGCGKSNIVDAVKWVLGEQSAKSLRGSEMTDVIFNGSATRHPAGTAQVTLVFDNDSGILRPNVSDEESANPLVSVSRRLYRSGQSEYLINKTPCRLRDIREMFMDTGIGVDAYSLIEQGRVEAFLRASQDDRRAIFDEAAGISRYKARKKETLRKLERVEQNLLRLNDIIGEIDKRLRSIKYQAGKARNYQAYAEKLKNLRFLYFLAQYHTLTQERKTLQRRVDSGTDELSSINTKIDQLAAASSATEVELDDLERTARKVTGKIATIGASITTCQERAEMFSARMKELSEQIVADSSRCEEIEAKIDEAQRDMAALKNQLQQVQDNTLQLAEQCNNLKEEYSSGEVAMAELKARLEDEKEGTIDLLRRTAHLHNEITGQGIRRENLHSQKARLDKRAEEIAAAMREMFTDRAKLDAKLRDVSETLSASRGRLGEIKGKYAQLAENDEKLQGQLSIAREQRSALLSRTEVLNEMQSKLEGVATGVRKVLRACRDGHLPAIRGMLGDFIRTDTEHAPLVEAALAGADQYLLADGLGDLAACREELTDILSSGGAVEVLCMDRLGAFKENFDISTCPKVIGRVIDWISFESWLSPAIWRLLGRTLIVETIDDAIAAAKITPQGYRFVTLAGEVVEPDGRVRLGTGNISAGVIARHSELAELESRRDQLEENIEQLQQQCRLIHLERQHTEDLQQSLRTAIYEASTEHVETESRLKQINEQIERLGQEKPVVAIDLKQLAEEIDTAVRAEHDAKEKVAELDKISEQRQQQIERLNEQITSSLNSQEQISGSITELKIAIATANEKKLAIKNSLDTLSSQRQQMQKEISTSRLQIEINHRRRKEAEDSIQKATSEVDRLYDEQKDLNRESDEIDESSHSLQEKLRQIRQQLVENRKLHDDAVESVNTSRVELSGVDAKIENLIARAADEMNMNLLESIESYEHDENRDWNAVSEEIKELRGKIERLGNINLDAISEQEELLNRRETLATQLDDIQTSKDQLDELVRRINKISQRMFLETFENVRTSFQKLFRKLFGGGRADIILIDPNDVLESGIEIVARPPGKDLRSISLLSGGEKAMTALALMFSVFKSKPSPFCLLDEVDAALDETNNERFCQLVSEFVSESQFIIITHSKRTMSITNVLYGITMQEPGVSKKMSVRFEDAVQQQADQLEPVGA